MAHRYELAVIGTGTAATSTAMQMRSAGWSVAVIDHRPFGGTCALRGCDPKKMMVAGAAAVDHARRMRGKGVDNEVALDWQRLMAFKRSYTGAIPESREKLFADNDIATFRGRARFTGPQTLAVEGKTLEAEHIVIAAGAEPISLGIPGEEHLFTSDQFLELDDLPPRVLMVGGGYIAAEFSHLAARAGASVTILQRADRILKQFDPDLVSWLIDRFKGLGINVRTGASVEAIERTRDGYGVRAKCGGETCRFETDMVVHAAGRAPALQELDLEAGKVAQEQGQIVLDDFLQSVSNPAVFAAGDAAQVGPPLTPVASLDAEVVAENLLHGRRRKAHYPGAPKVAFTIPPIAAVGRTETEAREEGYRCRMKVQRASGWFTATQAAEPVYGFKTLVDEETDRILGAHLVGPRADEVINLFALAIRYELTATQLKSSIFAYPTGASDIESML
jgi:glutathione reductase (NADPH)